MFLSCCCHQNVREMVVVVFFFSCYLKSKVNLLRAPGAGASANFSPASTVTPGYHSARFGCAFVACWFPELYEGWVLPAGRGELLQTPLKRLGEAAHDSQEKQALAREAKAPRCRWLCGGTLLLLQHLHCQGRSSLGVPGAPIHQHRGQIPLCRATERNFPLLWRAAGVGEGGRIGRAAPGIFLSIENPAALCLLGLLAASRAPKERGEQRGLRRALRCRAMCPPRFSCPHCGAPPRMLPLLHPAPRFPAAQLQVGTRSSLPRPGQEHSFSPCVSSWGLAESRRAGPACLAAAPGARQPSGNAHPSMILGPSTGVLRWPRKLWSNVLA